MDCMVDIETMSVSSTRALVLSVAAVKFEMALGGPVIQPREASFSAALDLRSQLLLGRKVDPETQAWWSRQDDAAKQSLLSGSASTVAGMVTLFEIFVGDSDSRIWANGTTFDVANLDSLCEDHGVVRPWRYNAPRDARTIYQVCQKRREAAVPVLTPHDPYDDCVWQIWRLWEHWDFGDTPQQEKS